MDKIRNATVTGHTQGVGKGIIDAMRLSRWWVQGFSRSNGYDISDPSSIEKIVKASKDCDVFINNAFHWWGQVELLYALYDEWHDQNKTIVNISSNSGEGTKTFKHKYAVSKKALNNACEQLRSCYPVCRIINVKFGWVDTQMLARHEKRTNTIIEKKLSVDEVTERVLWVLNQPEHICIEDINFQVK